MNTYVIYQASNGEIIRTISAPLAMATQNLEAGQALAIGSGNWREHRVENGVVVSLPQPRVFPYHGASWDPTTATFVDLRPLEVARTQAWAKVKEWREAAIDADMPTPYGAVQCRPDDRKNITDAVMMAQTLFSMAQPVAIEFTMADNSVVTMDASMMTNIGLLLGQKTQAAHARARELRAQIATATKEQLHALTWD